MNVLVAGGAGYIGSHTVKLLKAAGHNPVIYDNGVRGHKVVADILGVTAIWADLADTQTLAAALTGHKIDVVMHFAAYAYVGESVDKPLMYYRNNTAVTLGLLEAMKAAGVNKFVFSSTCATYGDPDSVPITEGQAQRPVSPYGRSKLMVEHVLKDHAHAEKSFSFAALRYFNACGCAADGTLGEQHDPETHLIPVILQVALGQKPKLVVFGEDYPTPDGTNVRDYIHVDDLGSAHILAMEKLSAGSHIFANLGTGHGFSVKEIIEAARKVTGHPIPVEFGPRRPGDAIALYADPSYALKTLGWKAKYQDPTSIIQTAWKWFKAHPNGY